MTGPGASTTSVARTTAAAGRGRDRPPAPAPAVGSSATLTHAVRAEDAATAWGNDLPVLATPVLLWLSEIAAMRAVADGLPPAWMTVGAHHSSDHLAPTRVGENVIVRAELVAVEGRSLVFDVEAEDGRGAVLRGRHRRGLVHTATFRERFGL